MNVKQKRQSEDKTKDRKMDKDFVPEGAIGIRPLLFCFETYHAG